MNGHSVLSGGDASASSQGPPLIAKKHRRPALSCIQCRRRKVKCDRNVPCNRCIQAKNVPCVYDPEAPARARAVHSATNVPTMGSHKPEDNFKISAASTFQGSLHTPAPSLRNTVSPVESWVRGPQVDRFPTEQPSVQGLKDRIQQLESTVSFMSQNSQNPEDAPFVDGPPNDPILHGSHDSKRFCGMGHWFMIKKEFDQINLLKTASKSGNSEIPKLLQKCKAVARAVKAQRPANSYPVLDFRSQVPPRETVDVLVGHYFRLFESTHRILHRHSFYRDYENYWNNPSAVDASFIVKLLLVISIGTIFCIEDADGITFRNMAPQWISAAQTWLDSQFQKAKLNLASIEVQCLLFLARQVHSYDNDSLWVSSGSLIRSAMRVGLHRDPSHFPKISVFHAECRRRLWATVLDVATESSLDCGMPPLFSFDDFDCEPPSNYDDADIEEQTKAYPPTKPTSVFTESSVQITLLASLRTRTEISKLLNDFRGDPGYSKTLALGTELTAHFRSHVQLYQASELSQITFTTFQKNLLDIFNRRFLLALHLPFAVKAKTNPRFYFSRKIAVESAMAVLAYPGIGDPTQDYGRMVLKAGGFLRESVFRASAAICLELINQINEDSTSSFTNGPSPARMARNPLHEAVDVVIMICKRRLEHGETNAKAYMFCAMLKAQTLAMENGEDVQEAIISGAKCSLEEACDILQNQVTHEHAETLTPASGADGFGSGMSVLDNFDWDILDPNVGFDIENTWMTDSLGYGSNNSL